MLRPLAVAALFCVASPAFCEVIEKDVEQWYEVRQLPDMSLLDAILAATPIRQNGRRFHGYTDWDIRWRFGMKSKASGACEISSVRTELKVTMTLPKLAASTPSGAQAFESYFPALLQHEQGHRAIALEAAQAVDQSIAQLPAADSCQLLSEAARRVGQEILETSRKKQADYDAETRHGCSQGACLPPKAGT